MLVHCYDKSTQTIQDFFDFIVLFTCGFKENDIVPINTNIAPIKCILVKAFSKYKIEMQIDMNFRRVSINVTVRLENWLINQKTDVAHIN